MRTMRQPWGRWAWLGALFFFILAAFTGALFRYGAIYGVPWGLHLDNIRHAHSHLMYFGWVTPALMAFMAAYVEGRSSRGGMSGFRRVVLAILILSVFVYIPFLLYGYKPAPVGEARIPFSVIFSTLHIFAWYAFVGLYWRHTRGMPRTQALRLWDAATVFLVVASLGAWGRAVLAAFKVTDPFWASAMVHLFLDVFSDGWLVLGVLGLVHALHDVPDEKAGRVADGSLYLFWLGVPLAFLLGMPLDLVPPTLRTLAGVGGALLAFGLFGQLWVLRDAREWRLPLILLAIDSVATLGLAFTPVARWGESMGLRILYLHVLLLGFVSMSLWRAAEYVWGGWLVRGRRWFDVSVVVLLLALIPLTRVWPSMWQGRWAWELVAWLSWGPVLVGTGALVAGIVRPQGEVGHMWQRWHVATGQSAGSQAGG